MKKLENKLKIFAVICITGLGFLWINETIEENSLNDNQLPVDSDQNIYIENAYLEMTIEQLLDVVVVERTSATMSYEALCYVVNDSYMDEMI